MTQFYQSLSETKDWLDSVGIQNYTINDDLTIDVDVEVDLEGLGLDFIPVQFRCVTGNFYCQDNQLISLAGCPKVVTKSFVCSNNPIESLEGSPEYVGDDFITINTNIKNLRGSPRAVVGDFECVNNVLDSMSGLPDFIGYNFVCHDCNGKLQMNDLVESLSNIDFHGSIYSDFPKSDVNCALESKKIFKSVNDSIDVDDLNTRDIPRL